MTKVVLHGALAKAIGKAEWLLDIRSPAEAIRAIEANCRRAYKYLRGDGSQSLYRVLIDGKDFSCVAELSAPIGNYETIHFVPVLAGSDNTGTGGIMAIIGIALLVVVLSVFTFGAATPAAIAAGGGLSGFLTTSYFAGLAFAIGLSLTLGGIATMLTAIASPGTKKKATNEPNYNFAGPVNTVDQGLPVPVMYGTLIVGSATISAGITANNIPLKQNLN
jgi:predicted phage tail protein